MKWTAREKAKSELEQNISGLLRGLQDAKEYRYEDDPNAPVEAGDYIADTLNSFTQRYADVCVQWNLLGKPGIGEFSAPTEAMIEYLQHIVEIMSVD